MENRVVAAPIVPPDADEAVSLWSDAWQRILANRLAVFGLIVIAFVALTAVFGPWITPYDFLSQDLGARNQAPSFAHWFGTDDLGRDVLSRVIYGARTAFFVSVIVTAIALLVGVVLGATAGYAGGFVDGFITWLADMTMSVPSLLLAVVITASLKPPLGIWMEQMYLATLNPIFRSSALVDFTLVFGAIALVTWPGYCRLVRAQVLSIRSRNYVTAARALGLPTRIILVRYVIPNALGPVVVAVSAGLGAAMVLESAFSFLGVGVHPPIPSWGSMISDGLRVWRTYPHILAAPAAVLGVVTIAFSFLGDGLNDALNPKQWRK